MEDDELQPGEFGGAHVVDPDEQSVTEDLSGQEMKPGDVLDIGPMRETVAERNLPSLAAELVTEVRARLEAEEPMRARAFEYALEAGKVTVASVPNLSPLTLVFAFHNKSLPPAHMYDCVVVECPNIAVLQPNVDAPEEEKSVG